MAGENTKEGLYKVCLEYYIIASDKTQAQLCVTSSISPEDDLGFEVISIFEPDETETIITFMQSLSLRMENTVVEEVMTAYLTSKGIEQESILEVIDALHMAIKERELENDGSRTSTTESDQVDSDLPGTHSEGDTERFLLRYGVKS